MSKPTVEEMARELARTNVCPGRMESICPIRLRGKRCQFTQTAEQCWWNKSDPAEITAKYEEMKQKGASDE